MDNEWKLVVIVKKVFNYIRNFWLILLYDILMIPVAWFGAFLLRFNLFSIPANYLHIAKSTFLLVLVIQFVFYVIFNFYRGLWGYVSIHDLIQIIKSVLFAVLAMVLVLFLTKQLQLISRSVFPLYSLLLIALLAGARLLYRYFKDHKRFLSVPDKRVLIIGAGTAGDGLVRDLLRNKSSFLPVAFVDDNRSKLKQKLHGIKIEGTTKDLDILVKKFNVDLILIAITSISAAAMKRIVDLCRDTQVPFQTLPGVNDLAYGRVTVNQLRDVAIEDLLGRDQVRIDVDAVRKVVFDKKVVVTGGGGSIGSELCRQIAAACPKQLIIIDHSEFNLYNIKMELKRNCPECEILALLLSVTDRESIADVMEEHSPEIVFHAAAYKHVPLLENQINVAIKNNALGTYVMASLASQHKVNKFILISSDKAVNPVNVMGATKRTAELICKYFSVHSATKFITVRFGNVLGSVGSVVPLFKSQLAVGGPITVTHPDITRYFMTIKEAVSLVLEACGFGEGGDVFVLNMGELIEINYLAEQMIRLSGKKPGEDIKVEYVGLRPGEKMYEELFYPHESKIVTQHEKIWKVVVKDEIDEFRKQIMDIAATFNFVSQKIFTHLLQCLDE
ncbi:MAG: nucleoside-diphosphate sugar epimerase/dehydratase [Gammaproteobacteria bacterium]|jgi:FlaA1/EpsC-like NDP-sugar epimerase